MSSFRVWLSAVGVVLLACDSEPRHPKPPEFAAAFSNLPFPPQAEFVSRSGGADALQITLYTPIDLARTTDYYREVLGSGAWRLVSDIKNRDGSAVLYAEHNGPPLWARLWKPDNREGTMVQLTGAVIGKDSARSRGQPDTSNRR
jgi:hypothetical protein